MPFDFAPIQCPEAKVLRGAADYIEEHGWCQRALSLHGAVCAVGAINMVMFGKDTSDGATEEQKKLRRRCLASCSRVVNQITIIRYNNAPGRTKEEVIAALRGAADAEEMRGAGYE